MKNYEEWNYEEYFNINNAGGISATRSALTTNSIESAMKNYKEWNYKECFNTINTGGIRLQAVL